MAAASFPSPAVRPVSAQALYEKLGWSIIPVDCTVSELVGGKLRWRKPALVPWRQFMTRRADELEIASWRRRFPQAGIGVVCGSISNLLVLDADGAAGVEEATRLGLPETPMVQTPSGGLHVYFSAVPGSSFRNGAKMGASGKIDVRSDGGYVAAPHSMRGDGRRYVWIKHPETTPIAEAPDWFLRLLDSRPTTRAPLSVKPAESGVSLAADRQGDTDGGAHAEWLAKLPDWARQLVLNGHDLDRYPSRSECDLEVVTLLACVGAAPSVIEGIFETYPIGDKFRESSAGPRYLERTVETAFRNVLRVRVKYADLREYDRGGKRLHVALDAGDNRLIRTGVTVPTPGNNELAVRWRYLFEACGTTAPGPTKAEIEQAARSIINKRLRVLVSWKRENPVVGFYAL